MGGYVVSAARAGAAPALDARAWLAPLAPVAIALLAILAMRILGAPPPTDGVPSADTADDDADDDNDNDDVLEAIGGRAGLLAVACVMAVGAMLALQRFPAGEPRTSWPRRLAVLLGDARTVASAPAAPGGAALAAAFAEIPAGASVAVLVERPDLVPHDRHTVADVTVPGHRCRTAAPAKRRAACAALDRALDAAGARHLVVSESLAPLVIGAASAASPGSLRVVTRELGRAGQGVGDAPVPPAAAPSDAGAGAGDPEGGAPTAEPGTAVGPSL
jgi:hypothetical protein